jgi:hemerythrin
MAYIVWKDSFFVGVEEMDKQHEQFVAYVNELYDALQSGDVETVIVPIHDNLTNYIQLHFAAEESLLSSLDYPMLEIQKNQHAYYVSALYSMKSTLMTDYQKAQNTLLLLKDWFLHHIMTEDLKYGEFIKTLGTCAGINNSLENFENAGCAQNYTA